jgi:hypothetical protein
VKSLKVLLSTKGSGAKPFTNFEVVKIQYNKNGDEVLRSVYFLIDFVDFIDSDTMIYDKQNRLIEKQRTHNFIHKKNADSLTKQMFSNSKSRYNYEYDNKGNCIKMKVIERNDNKYELNYIYDNKNRKIKYISFRYGRPDTIVFKYNAANQCIEEGKYKKYGYKEVKVYAENGLLERAESYQDADVVNRTMNKPWQTFIYSYNDKKQLIKEDITHSDKGNWNITYTYYTNGLPKDEIEDMNPAIYTYATTYEYWD